MEIIWDYETERVRVAPLGRLTCFSCEKERPHSIVLVYHYFHMWYVFGHVYRREYFIECDRCRSGVMIDPTQYREVDTSRDPVPFLHRRGIVCLLIGVPVAVTLIGAFFFTLAEFGLL